jgi:hypothetical protein
MRFRFYWLVGLVAWRLARWAMRRRLRMPRY